MPKHGIFWLLALTWISSDQTASADDYLTLTDGEDVVNVSPNLAYLHDPRQEFNVEDLLENPGRFTRNEKPILNPGFVRGDLWLLLEFRSEFSEDELSQLWYLNLGTPHPTRVDFYHYVNGIRKREFHGGNDYPFSTRDIENANWVLSTPMYPGEHLLLVRLTSRAMIQGKVTLEFIKPMLINAGNYQMVYGVLFGFFGVLMMFNLAVYLVSRETSFLFAFGVTASILLFQISYSGFGFQYLWPQLPAINSFMIRFPLGMMFSMVGCFVISYLKLGNWFPALGNSLLVCSALAFFVALFPIFAHFPAAGLAILFLIPVLSVSATISAFRHKVPGARFLLTGFLVFSLFVAYPFLSSLGIVPHSPVPVKYFDFGMLMMAIILTGGLAIRFNEERLAIKLAEQSTRSKNMFLAMMSHEIRTPMNGVLGMMKLLLSGDLPVKQLSYARMAYSSAESLLSLINDILDFSKIEAGKLELELLDIDIAAHLEDVVEFMALSAQQKGIELLLDNSALEQPTVSADPGRLRQILVNLIGNAIKFTVSGEVVVSAKLKSHCDCLTLNYQVSDTGIGIDKKKFDDLFERFTQVDESTTREYGGTGLGLAIVKHLCDLMSGDIQVTSSLGVGSQFNVNLTVEPGSQSTTQTILQFSEHKILIVDSNKTAAEIISRQLLALGATADWVASTGDALSRLSQPGAFDTLFIDAKLQEQLTAEISGDAFQNLDVFLMTNLTNIPDEHALKNIGINASISKPITATKLIQLLQSGHLHSNLQSASNFKLSDKRILLVEDNAVNTEVALNILEDLGFETDSVVNGRLAIDILKESERPFDLILMDCQMPVLDGYETTKEIRLGSAGQTMKQIPILAMTAHAMKGDREKCLAAGMNDYISKPIDTDNFERKVQQWLVAAPINSTKHP